jgi:antitoxin VapB
MSKSQHVSLLPNGTDQVLMIPHEFALPGTEVLLRKEGNRLIVEPIPSGSLLVLLTTLEDTVDDFPDVDAGLLPLDEIIF